MGETGPPGTSPSVPPATWVHSRRCPSHHCQKDDCCHTRPWANLLPTWQAHAHPRFLCCDPASPAPPPPRLCAARFQSWLWPQTSPVRKPGALGPWSPLRRSPSAHASSPQTLQGPLRQLLFFLSVSHPGHCLASLLGYIIIPAYRQKKRGPGRYQPAPGTPQSSHKAKSRSRPRKEVCSFHLPPRLGLGSTAEKEDVVIASKAAGEGIGRSGPVLPWGRHKPKPPAVGRGPGSKPEEAQSKRQEAACTGPPGGSPQGAPRTPAAGGHSCAADMEPGLKPCALPSGKAQATLSFIVPSAEWVPDRRKSAGGTAWAAPLGPVFTQGGGVSRPEPECWEGGLYLSPELCRDVSPIGPAAEQGLRSSPPSD